MDQAPSDTAPVLELRNLRVEATTGGNRVTLIEDVSFTLHPGEVLALVGEAGAGRSTVGLSALTYTRSGCQITGGQILFHGTDLRGLNRHRQRILRGAKVGYIAQRTVLNPARTILDQVCEVALEHRVMTKAQARAEALRLFKELDLARPETFGQRYPHQASPGSLQRAMVAMALVAKPDLLVFDEPTATLDATTQVEVLASFKRLIREQAIAALFTTGDLAIAAQIADRIMVLRQGKVIEAGATAQVLHQPRMDYTRALVAERTAAEQGEPPVVRAAEDAPVLECKNLIAGYRGGGKVIDDVTIDLKRGETLALVGESASGKSALARVIVGLLPARSGELILNGASLPRHLKHRSKDQRRRIQMIHRVGDAALNPRHTVLDLIGRAVQFYFGRSGVETRARVEELVRQVDLAPEDLARRPRDLSDGQKQRVSLARALAAEPDIIVCDEVTSGLDPLAADELLRLLRGIQGQIGIACLFITHDLSAARRVAHRMAVMQKGKLIVSGPTEQVFNPPYHPHFELLLSAVPEMRSGWLEEALAQRRKAG